ncbi:MAG: HD domain-containing protein [Gemmatimonadetes bacterium]|nr:HD domain-containing protein [Gemmatimonadota bacterium]
MSTGVGTAGQSGSALQAQGKELLVTLYAALQNLKLYPLENAAVQNALNELHRVVKSILQREGMLELRLAGDFLFLNDSRLRFDLSNYLLFSSLASALSRHGIGSVSMAAAVGREEWAPFLSLLLRTDEPKEDAFNRFAARLAASPAVHIRTTPERETVRVQDDEARQAAKRAYVQAVQVTREVLSDMRLGKAVNIRRVKRAIQTMVDQVLNNETSMLGMTTLRGYDEYTFTHCVNVCIFSLVLGQKLGLDKNQLYELGVAALFHDIGKTRIAPDLINKTEGLTEAERQQVQQHPTEGLLALFSMHGFAEPPYRAMLVAYEHHMKLDVSGYPRNRRPRKPTLFSRIVAVTDGFDAATSKRSYQALPWRPEDVFREMRDNTARGYDPLLVKAFVNVTGVFPVGTVVILDTYELAVVVAPNPDPQKVHQPIVRLHSDASGLPLAEPVAADLSEIDPATERPRRTIIKTTDPERYGIRVADYFV